MQVSLAIALAAALGAQLYVASAREDADVVAFRAFLRKFEQGTTEFINGDAGLWKRQVSARDDVTIMGGWGAWEKGPVAVGQRYEWAVGRFRRSGATNTPEYLAVGVSDDLAYTVTNEHSVVHLIDQDAPKAMTLRVTTIFRREGGTWKLVHRHEDPLIAKTAPAAVIEPRDKK
jgi:ketosteroid isomerase-like protein